MKKPIGLFPIHYELKEELRHWLKAQSINGDNIGDVRRSLFVPWDSEWNGIVRDETAAREMEQPSPVEQAKESATSKFVPYLTGKEPWFVASQQGEQIWIRQWGDKGDNDWWPLVFVEMDTGLAKIDVCGKTQNVHLSDYKELRIGLGEIVKQEDFQSQPDDLTPPIATLAQDNKPLPAEAQDVLDKNFNSLITPPRVETCPTCGSVDKATRESVSKANCGPPLFPCPDPWHQPEQEKTWVPKFKVGDKVKHSPSGNIRTVSLVFHDPLLHWNGYRLEGDEHGVYLDEVLEPYAPEPKPNIILTHHRPPIPVRSWDWSAHRDGKEEGPLGWGATKDDAISDLLSREGEV